MIQTVFAFIVWLGFAGCFAYGGAKNLTFRREFGTWIIAVYCLCVTRCWWVLTQLLSEGIMHLGYGDKSIFRHVFGDAWGRGVWSFLTGLGFLLPIVLTGHMDAPVWLFHSEILTCIVYLVACFFCEPLFKNLPQIIGDLLIGGTIGTIVFITK